MKIRYLTKQCKSAKIELDVVLENITQTQLLSQVNCVLCWHVMIRQKPCFLLSQLTDTNKAGSECLNSYQNIFLSLPRIVPISLHFVNAFTQKSQEMFGCLWGAKQLILNSRIVWIETSVRKLAQTYYFEYWEKLLSEKGSSVASKSSLFLYLIHMKASWWSKCKEIWFRLGR